MGSVIGIIFCLEIYRTIKSTLHNFLKFLPVADNFYLPYNFIKYRNYSVYHNSFIVKYTYIKGYIFQLHKSIIRPLPKNRSISDHQIWICSSVEA